jgi:NNP family nitrate/nitrite transporter-like MFS transporter
MVFPLFKSIYGGEMTQDWEFDRASDLAWRSACVVPAVLCLVMAFVVIRYSDDSPKGSYSKRRREGRMPEVSTAANIKAATLNLNTWILFVQYGCCFGVEITMVNACALYFHQVFGLSTESAAAIASIFGWMNLFARGVGGFLSDLSNSKNGMRGRLWVQVAILLLEGIFIILFGHTQSLAWAICAMIILSIFVQAAEGSTYGIVSYINPSVTGSVAGIVGAGGNVGGVAFSLIFRECSYATAFTLMGVVVLSSTLLSLGFSIQGHAALCVGGDSADVVRRRDDYNASFGTTPPLPPRRNTSSVCLANMVDDASLSNLSRNPKNV